jgi:hypothetical protein
MSKRQGPPKHQNSYAWKPNLGRKINETVSPLATRLPLLVFLEFLSDLTAGTIAAQEPGGRFRPLSEITGVCQRCRDQIDWKRKYGPLSPSVYRFISSFKSLLMLLGPICSSPLCRYGKYKPIVEPAKWYSFLARLVFSACV